MKQLSFYLVALSLSSSLVACVAPTSDEPGGDETTAKSESSLKLPSNFAASYSALDDKQREDLAGGMGMTADQLADAVARSNTKPAEATHAPPLDPPMKTMSNGTSCAEVTDYVELCFKSSGSGNSLQVEAWIDLFGVESPHKVYGGANWCERGGLKVSGVGATYSICFLRVPLPTMLASAEACWLGACSEGAYVKVFD